MSSPTSFRSAHQEALELEVSILQALLRRNRCSQQRTKYYQRLSMAFRALHKHAVLTIFRESTALLKDLEESYKKYKTKRKRQEVFWDIKAKVDEKEGEEIKDFSIRLNALGSSVIRGLPECLSRLEYAADSLFVEVSRGFFLPFCTVAVAAIARIRTLLLCLGRFALLECLPDLELKWKALLSQVKSGDASRTNDRLWGSETAVFQQAKSILTSVVGPVEPKSRPQSDRMHDILLSVGLSESNKSPSERSTASEKTEIGSGDAGSSEEKDEAPLQNISPEELVDVGEAVFSEKTDFVAESKESKEKTDLQSVISSDPMDRNTQEVQRLRAEKKSKALKRSSSDASSKKKKKKRPKKGDFFDDLFAN